MRKTKTKITKKILCSITFIIVAFGAQAQSQMTFNPSSLSPDRLFDTPTLRSNGKFSVIAEYFYEKKRKKEDSALVSETYFDESGRIKLKFRYLNKQLETVREFFWEEDRLTGEKITEAEKEVVITYSYDNLNNLIGEKKLIAYGNNLQDSIYLTKEWQYDDQNRIAVLTNTSSLDFNLVNKTFHYLNDLLYEEKITDKNGDWLYSNIYTHPKQQFVQCYRKNSAGQRLSEEWLFDAHNRLISNRQIFEYLDEKKVNFEYNENGLLSEIHENSGRSKLIFKYFYR